MCLDTAVTEFDCNPNRTTGTTQRTRFYVFLLAFSAVSAPVTFVSRADIQDGLGVPSLQCLIIFVERTHGISAVSLYLVTRRDRCY